jgi:hypothetical protein
LPLATGQDILAYAQGIPYVSDILAGDTARLNVPPGAPVGATPEPTADVLGLFRGESPEEVGQKLLKSYYEKPLYGQIITDLLFNPINAIPVPIKGLPRAGYGKFLPTYDNYKASLSI